MDAYQTAVKLLAGRDLSVEALRTRLRDRGYPEAEITAAVDNLLESGALDDGRLARAYAKTAATVKGRGRLRVERELVALGIDRHVAAEAVGEVFGEIDERLLIAQALQKKLRGRKTITARAERARLYQYLLRQGFSPAGAARALGALGGQENGYD